MDETNSTPRQWKYDWRFGVIPLAPEDLMPGATEGECCADLAWDWPMYIQTARGRKRRVPNLDDRKRGGGHYVHDYYYVDDTKSAHEVLEHAIEKIANVEGPVTESDYRLPVHQGEDREAVYRSIEDGRQWEWSAEEDRWTSAGARHGWTYAELVNRYGNTLQEEHRLYREDMANLAGIQVRSLGGAGLPEPDGRVMQGGHARPWWWESTAREWLTARPGKGWRRGQGNAPKVSNDDPGPQRMIALLRKAGKGGMTASELAEKLGHSRQAVHVWLGREVAYGRVAQPEARGPYHLVDGRY